MAAGGVVVDAGAGGAEGVNLTTMAPCIVLVKCTLFLPNTVDRLVAIDAHGRRSRRPRTSKRGDRTVGAVLGTVIRRIADRRF